MFFVVIGNLVCNFDKFFKVLVDDFVMFGVVKVVE